MQTEVIKPPLGGARDYITFNLRKQHFLYCVVHFEQKKDGVKDLSHHCYSGQANIIILFVGAAFSSCSLSLYHR